MPVRRHRDRIASAARRGFAGRADELARLAAAVRAPEGPAVLVLHGVGGIGKTRLLEEAAARIDAPMLRIDCREVEPTPAGLLEVVSRACGAPQGAGADEVAAALAPGTGEAVLALDSYEAFTLLDAWLRRELVPLLPDAVLTVLSGRDRPSPAWYTTPGWGGLVERLELGPLPPADARALLAARGIGDEHAERIDRFARGHPLVLELAAAAARERPDLDLAAEPPADLLADLVRELLRGLDAPTVAAVRAAAVPRTVTEPLLAELLDVPDGAEAYERLRGLPFTAPADGGLSLSPVVREVVARDAAARDPEGHRRRRAVAARSGLRAIEGSRERRLWRATADLLHLVEHPIVRDAFFPPGAIEHPVEPAGPGDRAAILAIAAHRMPGPEEGWIARWLDRHPEAVVVVRDAGGGVEAFSITAELARVDPSLVRADPVAAAVAARLRADPVQTGERVLIGRAGESRDGARPSPALSATWLDMKRTYMEMRPRLRRIYVAPVAPGAFLEPLGFVPAGPPVVVGDRRMHPHVLDFGPGSVDGWLARLIGIDEAAPPAAGAAGPPVAMAGLSPREREVLRLLADGLSNRAIAAELVVSEKTVARHVQNLFGKLGVHSRAHAARLAAEAGMTRAPEGAIG